MQAVVSDILQSRRKEPKGLRKTALISTAGHAAAIALVAFLPGIFPAPAAQPRVVMNISLGGAPGPRTGGMQMIGGRRIEAAQPATEPKIQRSTLPTPSPQPKMTMPDPRQKPRAPAKPTAASKDPLGTARGRGFETQEGTARVETGARGQGFGLSSGGGGGMGGRLEIDNFCCMEYIKDMLERIRNVWDPRQQAAGAVMMKYTIQRSGQITNIEVEKPSGYLPLDIASQRSLINARLAPLPAAFPDNHLTVHLEFVYERSR
jgi:outer membrane biosynthesis protein TonB